MATRATTDNFLPSGRGQSHYTPRPVLYTTRQGLTPAPASRQPLISDFLPLKPPKAQPAKIRQPRKRLIYVLLLTLLAVGGLGGFKLTDSLGQISTPGTAAAGLPEATQPQIPAAVGLPSRLKIPKIGVDATFVHVGLTSWGELDVPKDPAKAGWYDQGPRPGQKGSAVIDGHFGWHDGSSAIFDDLHKLQKGDKFYVEDEEKLIITFVVRELQTFGPNETAPNVFISNDEKAHLNLITCHGSWNNTQKSYSERLVVFADRVAG